jgi:hypothetical protein
MASKYSRYGDPVTGSAFELLDASGEDTPLSMRLAGQYKPDNEFTRLAHSVSQTKGECRWYFGWRPTTQTTAQLLGGLWNGGISTINPSLALNKLIGKWKESDLDAGVSLAEGKESVELIIQRLNSIANAARSLQKGNLGGALRHLGPVPKPHKVRAQTKLNHKDPSSAFLELHLGWTPLVSDIYAAANLNLQPITTKLITPWVRQKRGSTLTDPNHSRFIKDEVKVRLVAAVESQPTLAERLGLLNPATIAWERVPFSFVVDYFIPIGEAISNLENGWRMKTKYVMSQTEVRTEVEAYCPKNVPVGYWYPQTDFKYRCVYSEYKRRRYNVSFSNSVSVLSHFKLPESIARLATMTALVHTNLSDLTRRK